MPHDVTMPQLGMAQDTGKIVAWLKSPGDAVAKGDALFEVETDKATMEIEAQASGFLTSLSATAGEDVPVGTVIARICETLDDKAPATPASAPAPPAPKAKDIPRPAAPAELSPRKAAPLAQPEAGRILASPKLRRLALEQGLDLRELVKLGHPQPFHTRDLETLRAIIPREDAQARATNTTCKLTAEIDTDGFSAFAAWAAETQMLTDADALLAGLAGASLPALNPLPLIVAIERHGQARRFAVPAGRALGGVTPSEDKASLTLRDLRGTPLRVVAMGVEATPTLTVMSAASGLSLTLECSPAQLSPQAAITFLTAFAGRMEQPLRHLL